ncbi:MAG: hypothetical protein AAFX54_06185 [Pseudomonadota bacterium]
MDALEFDISGLLTRSGRVGAARASAIIGVITLIAACFMPLVVAYDDARAKAQWEGPEVVKILGVTVATGEQEFVPPSEKGEMRGCVMAFMVTLTFAGLAAVLLGVAGAISALGMAGIGALSGAGGVLLAAWLSPMGLAVLGVIAIVTVFMLAFGGFVTATDGGGC